MPDAPQIEVLPAIREPKPQPRRDSKGRVLPGSSLNPKGRKRKVLPNQWAVLSEVRRISKDLMEEKDDRGVTLFERTIRVLLQPVIEQRREGEPFYLVNHQTILATLEFLAERGDGRIPVPEAPSEAKGKTITVVIRAAQPAIRGVTRPASGPKAVPPAASSGE